jgi:hypothetical protein
LSHPEAEEAAWIARQGDLPESAESAEYQVVPEPMQLPLLQIVTPCTVENLPVERQDVLWLEFLVQQLMCHAKTAACLLQALEADPPKQPEREAIEHSKQRSTLRDGYGSIYPLRDVLDGSVECQRSMSWVQQTRSQ